MRLSEVIEAAAATGHPGGDPEVSLVTADSRLVKPGAVFFAVRGTRADGHDFAAAAARAGAVAVVAERPVECAPARLLQVESAPRALAQAAARFHGRPGEALRLAGVTGTNGKTTVAWLAEACLREAGVPTGLLGTVLYRWPGAERPAPHTTPDAVALQALLAEMVRAGARAAVLEVSSHALAQERVAGLPFRAAAFTNLTRDHLDYHGDLEGYFQAKRRLFREGLIPGGVAVVNADDPHGLRLAQELEREGRAATWRFGLRSGRELRAEERRLELSGIAALLRTPAGPIPVRSPLVGTHNLENLMPAAGLALALGVGPEAAARALSASAGAPGRLERLEAGGVTVFVDYAHTHDALRRVVGALRELTPRRLLLVFGCGGDRDRGKRPLMGEAAAAVDLAVVTSDNPRTEEPLAIIAEVVPGLERAGTVRIGAAEARAGARGYAVVPDRREAIALAVAAARPGDAVLVAGKGHEEVQIVGNERRRLDDREEARRALGTR
jgi:UDP-N-acetylmuramoyl-L-alanyl-D-glutamate--2,6-diaminopimelate ligase